MDQLKVCSQILRDSDVVETKLQILDFLLGLTGSEEGFNVLYEMSETIVTLLIDLSYHPNHDVARKAIHVLLNISAEPKGANILNSTKLSPIPTQRSETKFPVEDVRSSISLDDIFSVLWSHTLEEESFVTEYAIMILVNLSRNENIARIIYENLKNGERVIETIVPLAVKTNRKYDYLSPLLANLTQLAEVRAILMESNRGNLGKLITLIGHESVTRRNGAIAIIRNLSFSVDNHEYLLNPKLNLVSRLLLPLAGPEEFDDEDNEKLPLDLQYLPADKTRESEPTTRKTLLEIIMQLCATKFGRELLRKLNVYVILRELHKWEANEECLSTCEDVVNLLIRTEEEIGVDNLGNMNIPSDLQAKFDEQDQV